MSRKKKREPDSGQECNDVFHHKLTLERENQLLIEENVRLLKRVKELEDAARDEHEPEEIIRELENS